MLKPKEKINQFTFQLLPGSHLQFSANGKTVIASRGYNLGRWRTDTGELVQHRSYGGVSLLPTPNDKFVIECDHDGVFYLLDAATGKKLHRFRTPQSALHADYTAALSPDGKYLAANSEEANGTVLIWELATGKERGRCKIAHPLAYKLVFSPDGKYLAGSTNNRRVVLYENLIYLWDAATGREVRHFRSNERFTTCLAYSSDGRMLASGGGDKTVCLWEVATGKERHCFEGHQGIVRSVAFSAEGWRLASASDDTTALVWDTKGSTRTVNLTAKDVQVLWSNLTNDDATVAFQAIRRLAASPEQTLPLLRQHLKPVPAPDRKRVRELVDKLDSADFSTRQKAADELEKIADAASSLLAQIMEKEKPSLEVRRRLQQILDAQEHSPETLRAVRAMEVLEWIATPDAVRLIDELANGTADARLTREAVAARGRMRK